MLRSRVNHGTRGVYPAAPTHGAFVDASTSVRGGRLDAAGGRRRVSAGQYRGRGGPDGRNHQQQALHGAQCDQAGPGLHGMNAVLSPVATAGATAAAVRAREISAAAVTEAALERIARAHERLNAFTTVT